MERMETVITDSWDLEDIIQGRMPLPRKGNEAVIRLAQEFKAQYEKKYYLRACGQECERIFVLGTDEPKEDYARIIAQEYTLEGCLSYSESFKRKRALWINGGAGMGYSALSMMISVPFAVWVARTNIERGVDDYASIVGGLGITVLSFFVPLLCEYINLQRKQVKEQLEKTQTFEDLSGRLLQRNQADLKEITDGIKVYQGGLDEVSRDLKTPLARIETGTPDTYLHAKDNLLLRIQAYLLGADAIVHYQPGSGIGTPVRFAN